MRDEPIGERLRATVRACRVPIDPRCAALLTRLVDDGLVRFGAADPGGTGQDDVERIELAVVNLRRLLDDMVQQTRILRFDALHEPNFHSAVERLCPLWPFC